MNKCLNCGKPVKNKYCNTSCQNSHQNCKRNINTCNKKYGELTVFKVYCFGCKKEIEIIEREKLFPKKNNYYCYTCKGIRGFIGKKHTTESKLKMSLAKIGISNGKGRISPMKGKHQTEEAKQKISANNKGGRCKWFEVIKPNNEIIKVQGTWELRFAKVLNKLDENWIKITEKHKEFQFKWLDDNEISHIYTPDFYSPKLKIYYEIKGFWCKTDIIKRKFVEQLSDVKIIYYNDLIDYEKDSAFLKE